MTTATDKPLTKKALAELEKSEAVELILKIIGDDKNPIIYTISRHVSASGLSQEISLAYIKGGEIYFLTHSGAKVLGEKVVSRDGRNAIRVSGGGMDMGFHLVHSLSSVLFKGEERAGYKLSHRWL